MNVVAVAEGILQLLNHHIDWQSLRPTLFIANAHGGDVGVRIFMRWCFVDTCDSLPSHMYFSNEHSPAARPSEKGLRYADARGLASRLLFGIVGVAAASKLD